MRPRLLRRAIAPLLAACLLGAAALPAGAAQVAPDSSFAKGKGWLTTSIGNSPLAAYGVTTMAGGKIVVAGGKYDSQGNAQVFVVRYHHSGAIDRSFANNGIYTSNLPASAGSFFATAVGIQPQTGKIVVVGGYGVSAVLVMRLTTDGKLDRTFGSSHTGVVKKAVQDIGYSLAFTKAGRILVGSSNKTALGRPMLVLRFQKNGLLDKGFANDGIARMMFWNGTAASSAAAQSLWVSPKSEVVGFSHLDYIGGGGGANPGHGSAGIFRLSSTGKPVGSFGTNGHAEIAYQPSPGSFAQWFPCAMAVNGRQQVTVTGEGEIGDPYAQIAGKVTSGGNLSRGFGASKNGWAFSSGITDDSAMNCGSIITPSGGTATGVENWLIGLTASGAPDKRFGSTGLMTLATPANIQLNAMLPYGKSGRFLALGGAGNDLYLARFR
ncbi:MAG: hypothetical protein F2813_03545 [Actinobacteria bacterium]|uniref:Unannotated protein n=1 Tax=freshwater metagenome TaxID=449393 RepID=A0A6J5ZJ79_9ZZZZ|nr:hypothetical protein [Actinomycetota bacterium]